MIASESFNLISKLSVPGRLGLSMSDLLSSLPLWARALCVPLDLYMHLHVRNQIPSSFYPY